MHLIFMVMNLMKDRTVYLIHFAMYGVAHIHMCVTVQAHI